MARTGRPPKPTEEKRRQGNPGRRPLPNGGELAVLPAVARGSLDLRAAELFEVVLDQGVPWLASTDGPRLRLLREQLEERQGLRDAVLGGTGDRKQLRDLEKQIAEGLSALGFDPTSRARLGLSEVKRASKLDEIKARRVASPVGVIDVGEGTPGG